MQQTAFTIAQQLSLASTAHQVISILSGAPRHLRYIAGLSYVRKSGTYSESVTDYLADAAAYDQQCEDALARLTAECYLGDMRRNELEKEVVRRFTGGENVIVINDGAVFSVIHPSAQQPGKIQITNFSHRCGGPLGDIQVSSIEAVFKAAGAGFSQRAQAVPGTHTDAVLQYLFGPQQEPGWVERVWSRHTAAA